MSFSISTFIGDASTALSIFGTNTQEIVVICVFLISFAVWRQQGRRAASVHRHKAKLGKSVERSPAATPPNRSPRASKEAGDRPATEEAAKLPAPTPTRRSTCDSAGAHALERHILRYLEQYEFTRALSLFRGQEGRFADGEQPAFSEHFYMTFVESAVRVGKLDVVERLLSCMRRDGLAPSQESWRRMLKTLSSRRYFNTCLVVHTLFRSQLPTDKVIWSCLANAALQVGDLQRMPSMLVEYAKADLVAEDYVLFFRTYIALDDLERAEALFRRLGCRATPLMLNLLLLLCVNARRPEHGLELLALAHELEEGSGASLVDTTSYNTVIKGLAQAGSLASCFGCLRRMVARGLRPDDITCTTLLGACIEENNIQAVGEVIDLSLSGTHQAGTVMYTLFIKGLVKVNCLPKALELYEEMRQKAGAAPDVITYSVLIKALVDQHDLECAMKLVDDMKRAGHAPDDIIITHLLEGCRHEGKVALGEKIFAESLANGVKPSEFTLVMMLKLYGRVGAHQEAHDLLAGWEAVHGDKPTVVHYTCLMSGCLRRKQYEQAWEAYDLMKANRVRPDGTTLATLLPGMVAAQSWDRTLTLAREALAVPTPGRHKIPPETLNNALSQMQAASGYSWQAAELEELMRGAGVAIIRRRVSSGRLQAPRKPPLGSNYSGQRRPSIS